MKIAQRKAVTAISRRQGGSGAIDAQVAAQLKAERKKGSGGRGGRKRGQVWGRSWTNRSRSKRKEAFDERAAKLRGAEGAGGSRRKGASWPRPSASSI